MLFRFLKSGSDVVVDPEGGFKWWVFHGYDGFLILSLICFLLGFCVFVGTILVMSNATENLLSLIRTSFRRFLEWVIFSC